jgi:agmatinase
MKGNPMPKYTPADSLQAPRFCGVRTFLQLPPIQATGDVDLAFIGIPFDAGATYRTGQRFGPAALRNASVMIRRHNPIMKITVFDFISGVDYGDLAVVPGNIEETYRLIEDGLRPVVDAGIIPICLGGDHSITLAELRAVAKRHGPLALVHLDAHADTDEGAFGQTYDHGTPFLWGVREGLLNVEHSVSVGIRGTMHHPNEVKASEDLGIKVITAEQVRELGATEVARRITERVGSSLAFLTFDVDFVDPAYAPGTGTPEPEGFTSHEALSLIRAIRDIQFVAFDIVEMLPEFDPTMSTAHLGAHVGFEFASIVAMHKKNNAAYLKQLR